MEHVLLAMAYILLLAAVCSRPQTTDDTIEVLRARRRECKPN